MGQQFFLNDLVCHLYLFLVCHKQPSILNNMKALHACVPSHTLKMTSY